MFCETVNLVIDLNTLSINGKLIFHLAAHTGWEKLSYHIIFHFIFKVNSTLNMRLEPGDQASSTPQAELARYPGKN